MSKYIDAGKLIAEVRRLKGLLNSPICECLTKDYKAGGNKQLDLLLSFIDSLQQEQLEPTCETCGFYENDCPFTRGKFMPYPNKVYKDYIHLAMKEQEQQGKSTKKNCNNCPHCIDRKDQIGWHFRGYFGGQYKGKPIAEIEECPLQQERSGLPGVEESEVPGKDYIPVEWVDACEKYGKWKIVKQEQPEVDLEKTVEFECIGKKEKKTVQELINYYIDSECVDVADECGF